MTTLLNADFSSLYSLLTEYGEDAFYKTIDEFLQKEAEKDETI